MAHSAGLGLDDPEVSAAASKPFGSAPHYGRWVVGALVLVVVAQALLSLAANPAFQWPVVGDYLFNPRVLEGLWLTVSVTVIVFVLSCVRGGLRAAARFSGIPVVMVVSWCQVLPISTATRLAHLLV